MDTLTAILSTEEDFAVLLFHQVCEQVTSAIPGVEEATVTLLRDDLPTTAATTSDLVAALDRGQYTIGDGPCIRAAETGTLVRVPSAEVQDRWPVFARDSGAAGFDSFLSAPLVVETGCSGAINCYGSMVNGFAELDEKLLDLYTSAATATCASMPATSVHAIPPHRCVPRRPAAPSSTGQGNPDGDPADQRDEAFTLLVDQSQQEDTKVRELATRFVTQVTGTDP